MRIISNIYNDRRLNRAAVQQRLGELSTTLAF